MIENLKNLFFDQKSQKKTILKNFLWLGTSQVGGRLIRSAITIYSARALGTAGYGVFSYAMGLAAFFIFFKNMGVDAILTREVARRPLERDRLFATSFWLEIGLLVLTVLLLLFVAPLLSHVPEALVLIPAVTLMIVADDMKDFFIALFRGIEKMEWEAVVTVASNIAVVIFGFGALMISATPLYLALAYTAASVFGVLLAGGIAFVRHIRGFFGSFDRNLVMPILKSAWPIAIGGLASLFLFNVDIIMLGFWRTTDDVGIYSAAQKIVGILSVISTLIITSAFPVISRLAHQKDSMRMRPAMESIIRVLFLFSVPLILGGIVLSAPLLEFIFGAAYGSGAGAMSILLVSILVTFPTGLFSYFIFAYDEQRRVIIYPIIAALANIGLNFFLVPRFGMIGASAATLFTSSIYAFLIFRFCVRIEKFSFWRGFPKIFGVAVLMAVFTYLFQLVGVPVLANVIVSAGLYLIVLKALKEESLEEIIALVRPAKI